MNNVNKKYIFIIFFLICILKSNYSNASTIHLDSCENAKLKIEKIITNVDSTDNEKINSNFKYVIEKENNKDEINNYPISYELKLIDEIPKKQNDSSYSIIKTEYIDFSQVEVSSLNDYKFIIKEIEVSNKNYIKSDKEYEICLSVRKKIDSKTGNTTNENEAFISSIIDLETKEKCEKVSFNINQEYGHITIENEIEDDIYKDYYYKVGLKFNMEANKDYLVRGQDNKVIFNLSEITTKNIISSPNLVNDINTINPEYLYIKSGQVIKVGLDNENVSQIKNGSQCEIIIELDERITEKYEVILNGNTNNRFNVNVNGSTNIKIMRKRQNLPYTGIIFQSTSYILLCLVVILIYVILKNIKITEIKQ